MQRQINPCDQGKRHDVKWICRLLPLLLAVCWPVCVQAIEIMRWDRIPLAIPLQVGVERVIFVQRNVRVGVPASVNGKLRVQSAGGSIYLLARETIAPTRIQLQDAEDGTLILLDIAASEPAAGSAALEPVQIVPGEPIPVRYGQYSRPAAIASSAGTVSSAASAHDSAAAPGYRHETPVPVVLTRYAAQSLYAPLRTVEPVPGISRVSLRRDLDISMLLPTLPVRASVLAAWRLQDDVVTALRLQNTSHEPVALDPRRLQGDFIAATFQHTGLGPAGNASDTTVVYLVTRGKGLAQALLPVMSQIDAQRNLTVSAAPTVQGGAHEK
jgi:integrating conjugative element protein (TIGR03749 family)